LILLFYAATLKVLIKFDSEKDRSNVTKHGVSLAFAIGLDWDTALVWADARRNYGES